MEQKKDEVQNDSQKAEDKQKDAKTKPGRWWLAGDYFGYPLPVTS